MDDRFVRLTASSQGPTVMACKAATTQVEQVTSVVNVTHCMENLIQGVELSSVNLRLQLNSAMYIVQAPFHWNLALALIAALSWPFQCL